MSGRRLFIVGAGGFGREVFSWLMQMDVSENLGVFSGFLDEDIAQALPPDFPGEIIGNPMRFALMKGDQIVIAIGDPRARLKIATELRKFGVEFPLIQHPTATVGFGCRLGAGCILCPGAVITTNVTLGDFVIVNVHASVGHDAQLGTGVTLSGHVDVTGWAVLGEGVFLGSHASVLPRAKVGAYAKIGAGSVVLRSVNAGATVMGVPATQILP